MCLLLRRYYGAIVFVEFLCFECRMNVGDGLENNGA